MAYNPTIWINDDGTGTVGTPATANSFNNMEQGIKNNDLAISEHTEQINDLKGREFRCYDALNIELLNGWSFRSGYEPVIFMSGGMIHLYCQLQYTVGVTNTSAGTTPFLLPLNLGCYNKTRPVAHEFHATTASGKRLTYDITNGIFANGEKSSIRIWAIDALSDSSYFQVHMTYPSILYGEVAYE